ncbi:MAG: SusC/RagA family TonB-linked outer membrane protein [Spirosomataceae bacterium]
MQRSCTHTSGNSRKPSHFVGFIATLSLFFFTTLISFAQRTVTGKVTDGSDKSAMPGVTVQVKGSTQGTQTDAQGSYSIAVSENSTLVFSFIGKTTQEIAVGNKSTISVELMDDSQILNEVVVIGYGSQKKKDLTGSVVSISSADFVKGQLTTPEQLVSGKLAGVQITSNGGAPGSGSTIRIRGGSSLNANNDPLIVLDGVPLDNNGISGSPNALSLINPNDIETFTVLKDASATAIYGSRASNGVILITTKKGSKTGKMRVNFSSLASSASRMNDVNTLNATEFTDLIRSRGNATQIAALGTENTNWADQIYRTAYTTDNNLSVSGAAKGVPYRVSLGYLNQNGILKTSNMGRTSGSLNLSPTFMDNHLKVDINLKGSITDNRFADQGAIGSAVFFDPTQPVFSGNELYDGYFEWLDPSTGRPNTLAPRNPLAMLEMRNNTSNVQRSIGNMILDYKFHFLPELRANLNVAYDISASSGSNLVPATSALAFNRNGQELTYSQNKNNKTLEFYLNYVKDLPSINSRIDVMGGYSYQDFIRENTDLDVNLNGEVFRDFYYKTQNTLVSFYGRANYSLLDKYVATVTIRQDGSSRFSPETRWGLFPSAALAWKISEEGFLKGNDVFSELKLRLGYGVTGQQDIGSDYPYLPRYTLSQSTAQYQFGGTFLPTLRPEGYDANIKWEETVTYNAGIDFALKKGRISGSIDYYSRLTKDLLSVIPVPAGSNLTNQLLTNVGNIENEGVEFSINTTPVATKNVNWDLGFNITFNQNTITNLTKVADPTFPGILTGGIGGGVGNTAQIHTVGYPVSTFYLYNQVYDSNGKPLEGVYEDQNGDGVITPEDRIRYEAPQSDVFLGLSSQISIGKFSAGFVSRANIGNFVYNNVNSNAGVFRVTSNPFLTNVTSDALVTGFANNQYFSNYYLQNASFFRIDNINFGYSLGRVFNNKADASINANIQNALVITKYNGLDPEVGGGIDNNFYPRPRVFTLGVNIGF